MCYPSTAKEDLGRNINRVLTNDRGRQNMATSKVKPRAAIQTKGQGYNGRLAKDVTGQHKGQTCTLVTLISQLNPATLTRNNGLNHNRLNIARPLVRTFKVLPDRRGLNHKANLRQRRHASQGKVARAKDTLRNNSTRTRVTLATMGLHKFTDTVRRHLRGQHNYNRRAVLTNDDNRFHGAQTGRRAAVLVARRGAITLRHGHRSVHNQSNRTHQKGRLSRHYQAKFGHIGSFSNLIGRARAKVGLVTLEEHHIINLD